MRPKRDDGLTNEEQKIIITIPSAQDLTIVNGEKEGKNWRKFLDCVLANRWV